MTLKTLIAETIAEARRHGYTGADAAYELTEYDCDSIVCDLGRKPTRDEWAEAGYHHVGGAHVQLAIERSNSSWGRWVVWVGNTPNYFWHKRDAITFVTLTV